MAENVVSAPGLQALGLFPCSPQDSAEVLSPGLRFSRKLSRCLLCD